MGKESKDLLIEEQVHDLQDAVHHKVWMNDVRSAQHDLEIGISAAKSSFASHQELCDANLAHRFEAIDKSLFGINKKVILVIAELPQDKQAVLVPGLLQLRVEQMELSLQPLIRM